MKALVDYDGLIASDLWAEGAAPDKRTIQRWVHDRKIPHVVLGPRMIRFDLDQVRRHIELVCAVAAVVPRRGGSGNILRRRKEVAR